MEVVQITEIVFSDTHYPAQIVRSRIQACCPLIEKLGLDPVTKTHEILFELVHQYQYPAIS